MFYRNVFYLFLSNAVVFSTFVDYEVHST